MRRGVAVRVTRRGSFQWPASLRGETDIVEETGIDPRQQRTADHISGIMRAKIDSGKCDQGCQPVKSSRPMRILSPEQQRTGESSRTVAGGKAIATRFAPDNDLLSTLSLFDPLPNMKPLIITSSPSWRSRGC